MKKKSVDQLAKEYTGSLSSNYDAPKVIHFVRIEDIRAEERMKKSDMALKSEQRPKNFEELDAETQWMIDKELGILDWDGN